jgi:hypothetical protein
LKGQKQRVERLEVKILENLQRGHDVLQFDNLGKMRARLQKPKEKFKKLKTNLQD